MQFIVIVEMARIPIMSYIHSKEKEAFEKLTAEDFNISNIMNTMHKLYKEGALDVDDKWRNALMTYCNNHNINYRDVFPEIINILNKN